MKIEIQGKNAKEAIEELLDIKGFEGSYRIIADDSPEKEGVLAVIATIVGIVGGTIAAAEKLFQWHKKYRKSSTNNADQKIEKVLIVSTNGHRLLLKDAKIEQIKKILED